MLVVEQRLAQALFAAAGVPTHLLRAASGGGGGTVSAKIIISEDAARVQYFSQCLLSLPLGPDGAQLGGTLADLRAELQAGLAAVCGGLLRGGVDFRIYFNTPQPIVPAACPREPNRHAPRKPPSP
eukprot:SAG11_NODE_6662_length_1271_cov_1.700512_2_plen_126_part_00